MVVCGKHGLQAHVCDPCFGGTCKCGGRWAIFLDLTVPVLRCDRCKSLKQHAPIKKIEPPKIVTQFPNCTICGERVSRRASGVYYHLDSKASERENHAAKPSFYM